MCGALAMRWHHSKSFTFINLHTTLDQRPVIGSHAKEFVLILSTMGNDGEILIRERHD